VRTKSKLILLAATLALAACGENSVSPRAISPGGSNRTFNSADTSRFTFTIDPSEDLTYQLGAGNTVYFPAGSVCDPATSSYGVGTWFDSCTPISQPITISAKGWLDAAGHPYVDFQPALRFVPDSAKAVTLTLTDKAALTGAELKILYCPSWGSCVDETNMDPTLTTRSNPALSVYYRRIRHFSGYNVGAGSDSTCTDPSGCSTGLTNYIMSHSGMTVSSPGPKARAGHAKRSGYMATSG